MPDYRKLYKDLSGAFSSFNKSIRNLERIGRMSGGEQDNITDMAPSIMGEIYNATEVLVWLCNYYDSDPEGEQPWVSIRDIPRTRANMPITGKIRHAAREISKGSRPDFNKEIDPEELASFLHAAIEFVRWIIENARNGEVRHIAEELERLISRFQLSINCESII